MTPRDRLQQIKARHVPDGCQEESGGQVSDHCLWCDRNYPCDTARLVAFTEAVLDWADQDGADNPTANLIRHDVTALADLHLREGNKE